MEQEFLDMTVPESVSGLWRVIRHRGYALWKRVSELTERFWLSRGYFPLLLGVLVFALAADRQVAGAAALVSAAVPRFSGIVLPVYAGYFAGSAGI